MTIYDDYLNYTDEYKSILLDLLPSKNDLINWSVIKEKIIKDL